VHFHLRHDVRYKGKEIEKTLNTTFYICYIRDKKMKVVQVQNAKYVIQDREDEISLVHMLAREGYSTAKIAKLLGISEKTVIKYLGDCW